MRATQQRGEVVLAAWSEYRDGLAAATPNGFADEYGMKLDTLQTVLRRARARGDERGNYAPAPRKPKSRPRFYAVLEAWNAAEPGATYDQVAATLGVTHWSVASVLCRARREGLEVRPTRPGRPRSVIAEEWQHLREGGTSIHEAARRLNTTVDHLRSLA